MNARRVLFAPLGVLAVCVPSLVGCDLGIGGNAEPPAQQQPPSTGTPPDPTTPQAITGEPPPISGGTLFVLADGKTAVAADPDRDRVWIVDLAGQALLHEVKLQPGDEPGRGVEDASGRVHVVLRRGGALVSIDPSTGDVTGRTPVCPAPRGLAYDGTQDRLHVACADGRLVSFASSGGAAVRTVQLDGDLRDVVMAGGKLYVSTFRAAQLLEVASDGTIAQRITLPVATSMFAGPMMNGPTTAAPGVAYRAVATPGGSVVMLHQRAQVEAVATTPGGYDGFGMCPGAGIVHDAVTIVQPGTAPAIAGALGMITLAVDLALSPDGVQVAIAAPGSQLGLGSLVLVQMGQLVSPPPSPGGFPCIFPGGQVGNVSAAVTAVAFDGQGNVVAQTREPATLLLANSGVSIALSTESAASDGHDIFHRGANPKGGIACASCHPEGGDDGRVWQFQNLGARRTQNLRGGVLVRAPFHWSGDIPDMPQLVSQVYVGRMGGQQLDATQTAALGHWMDAQPALAPPPPADAAAVQRGTQIFNDPTVGCTGCHQGPQLSTHALVDVGTGGSFKVPSLIAVGYRAPYLHDGCAATLQDRFGAACGGADKHGTTQQLTAAQIDDLVAYLKSL